MRKIAPRIFMMLLLTCSLSCCEHKELCYDHDEHGDRKSYKVTVVPDYVREWEMKWEDGMDWKTEWPDSFGIAYDSLRPKQPEGIRARVYQLVGSPSINNLPVTGGDIRFNGPEEHSLLFYNNDTEYIVFDELENYATAQATTRSRARDTYKGNSVLAKLAKNQTYFQTQEYTVGQPDMLYGSYMDPFYPKPEIKQDTLAITMHPLTYTYLIRFEFSHGLKYVSNTKGALAGMARKVFLNSGKTGKEQATILYDCEMKEFGAQALVQSFGVPDFPNPDYSRAENLYGVTLEVSLKNGLRKNFDFNVTDQVAAQPHGGVIIVSGIEVPDDIGGGGGGFDVDVEDWEGQENIPLPLDSIQ